MQTNKLKQLDKILIKYYTGRGFIKNCSSRRIVQREYREYFERAKPFRGKKTCQDILRFKPCWVGFTYCLIVNVISRSCRTKNTAYLYMVSKHFFFELTGILLNYDWLLTLLPTPRVATITCGSILLNTKHTKKWKQNYPQYALTSIQYFYVFSIVKERCVRNFSLLCLWHMCLR